MSEIKVTLREGLRPLTIRLDDTTAEMLDRMAYWYEQSKNGVINSLIKGVYSSWFGRDVSGLFIEAAFREHPTTEEELDTMRAALNYDFDKAAPGEVDELLNTWEPKIIAAEKYYNENCRTEEEKNSDIFRGYLEARAREGDELAEQALAMFDRLPF